jgi:hypothetical protein
MRPCNNIQQRGNPVSDDESKVIQLQRIRREAIEVPIIGDSPLIPHKWSEKALRMMRDKQGAESATRVKHAPKVAEQEAEACLYRLPDGRPGMPATAFKAAMVGAARLFSGITMVQLKSAVFVQGAGQDQLVPIEGDATLREDTPRNANGVADLRYRYAFYPWSALLVVSFLPSMISSDSVITLVDAAGNGGVGDWRPSAPKSATGTFGRFHVRES